MSKETKGEIIIGILALLLLVVLFVFAFPKMSNKTNKLDYVGTMGLKASLNDYTWDEISEISADIAEKGGASSYFEDFTRYAEEGQTKTVELSNGDKLEFRIIGIKHDNLSSDTSKKAGFTFMAQNALKDPDKYNYSKSPCNWNTGSLRAKIQDGGEIFTRFPEELTKNIKNVEKMSLADSSYLITTSDKFFIPSAAEVGFAISEENSEGTRYEYINNDAFSFGIAAISCMNHKGYEKLLKKNNNDFPTTLDILDFLNSCDGLVDHSNAFMLRTINDKYENYIYGLHVMLNLSMHGVDEDMPIVLCFCI